MSKKAVMRILASKEGWYCRYCRCKLLPIPDFEIVYEKNKAGEMEPQVRRVRWNLETMKIPKGYAPPTVDHKIPRCKGGPSDLNNLVLACRDCNSEKADKPYEEFYKHKEDVRRMNKHRQKL